MMRVAKLLAGLSILANLVAGHHTGRHSHKGNWDRTSSDISIITEVTETYPSKSTSVFLSSEASFYPTSSTATPWKTATESSLETITTTYATNSGAAPSSSNAVIWRPTAGTTWQIVLSTSPKDTALDVKVYDIDLFDNSVATIGSLKDAGYKVICYFSAGTFEDWRDDAELFETADKGSAMQG